MMYGTLYQYFLRYRQLPIPGIGTFLLERKPAVADFPNRIIHPPSFSVRLNHHPATPPISFFGWLAKALDTSDRDAVIRFNDFAHTLRLRINVGDKINWDGMGILSMGLGGEIRFEPGVINMPAGLPVKAEKVIREHAEHSVRVGEDERTSVEMIELLNKQGSRKNQWWLWALVLGLITTMFIGWYFSVNGLKTSSSGNNQKVNPADTQGTYKVLP